MFTAVLIFFLSLSSPDAIHLNHEVTVSFLENGSITELTEMIVIPLSGRGVQRFSALSVSFREGMETTEILEASVHHWRGGRGNSEAEISTGPHRILSRTNRLESSLRETIILMPGLVVGDTIKVKILRTIYTLPLANVYSYSYASLFKDSVVNSVFRINNPAEIDLITTQSADYYHVINLSPLPTHPLSSFAPAVFSVATGTPCELSTQAWEALDNSEHSNSTKLDEIVEQVGSNPGALRMWVANNINYTGADEGVWPGWSPRSPEETLTDGSGVCRDRSILLMWLLRKAGYEAYPALINTAGKTASLVDARSFDHMITVYRGQTEAGEEGMQEWQFLDPTPKGIPLNAGISFGLRGCSYLPLTPEGSQLLTIPVSGWNDSLIIDIRADLNTDSNTINGSLTARSCGVPLELISTIYTQSAPTNRNEMFKRFFGAVNVDSVQFDGEEVVLNASWDVINYNNQILIPGLREISLQGTRLASKLLPCPPDSFFLDAPAVEVLNMALSFDSTLTITLPAPISEQNYYSEIYLSNDSLFLREEADITNSNRNILNTFLLRNSTIQRTLVLQ